MEFNPVTRNRILLFDELFMELGRAALLSEPQLDVDWHSATADFLRFDLGSLGNESIRMVVSIEIDSLRLDLAGLDECFEWASDEIDSDRESVRNFFGELLTSFLLFESCGNAASKSRLYLFDKKGALLRKYILRGFVHKYCGWNCDKVLFFPVISSQWSPAASRSVR